MLKTLLIVEDDVNLRNALSRYLKRDGARILEAGSVEEAIEKLEEAPASVIVTDVTLPDGTCFSLLDQIDETGKNPRVIVMTSDNSIENAIAAMQRGALDFLLKPFSFEALDEALRRAQFLSVEDTATEKFTGMGIDAVQAWRNEHAPEILGSHSSLLRTFSIIERVADTDCSILITGESGTGKELVARSLHTAGPRRTKPFVTVNCAAIPENLLESELFGHVRGAFTGATNSRVGRFTAADQGTLFLDEIGEMPLSLQAKLLRVLQEKEVTPVGDGKSHKVDVRIVAATNRNLEDMVASGDFRVDLLYRLNVIPIDLVPLRERSCDIPELIEHFIRRTNERRKRNLTGIAKDALAAMQAYPWPGNIRQLENTIDRIVVLKTEGYIEMSDLPSQIRQTTVTEQTAPVGSPELPENGIDLKDAVEQFENALILQALERTGWNKNRAATILRMNRTTLVEKLKKKNFGDRVDMT